MKKDKKPNKFIEIIKKKWLIDGTRTFILVVAIIALFIGTNILMQKLELTPIDFSQDKLYTLTDESKNKVKDIDKDVHIYFIGAKEDDSNLDLAKQYKKANEKIVAEAVDINTRPDLAQKYGIESGTEGIIVESGEKSKVLSEQDLVTYDTSTYETINIAEEKITSAIVSVVSTEIPKIYFLEGYSKFSLSQNMNILSMYLQNEVNEVKTLNTLTTGKIPDDCDTLVITTPAKDFDEVTTTSITDYINAGKNIVWLNAAQASKIDLPNVNKILAMYGVNPFEVGIIRETDSDKMVSGSPDLIIPEMQDSKITEHLYNGQGAIFANATKINIQDEAKLEEQKIEKTDLLLTSKGAYFRTDFKNQENVPLQGEEKKEYIVGAELEKTIKESEDGNEGNAVKSKLIIYGENIFITDTSISQSAQTPIIALAQNKDLILNTLAYSVEKPENITARKNTGTVTYTATEKQDTIIKIIIFTVPILIIIAGIVVWQKRRRKK